MTFTDLLTRLNRELRDSDNNTFTEEEKVEALTRAVEDDAVCAVEIDTSNLFTMGTRDYPISDEIRQIYRMQLIGSSGALTPFDNGGYSFVANTLTVDEKYVNSIPTGTTMRIEWARKLDVGDDIPDYLVPYVLNMGIYYTTEVLASGKVNRFLRNDVSLSEIQTRGAMALRQADKLRRALPTQRAVAV